MKKKMILTVSAAMVLLSGCHFFEDADNVDECPLNSGWPCACDSAQLKGNDGYCYDQSVCIWWNNPTRGICSRPCDGVSDTQSCANTEGYGNEGLCKIVLVDGDTPEFCGIVCQGAGSGNCPPGMDCVEMYGDDYKTCVPRENE